MRQLVRINLLLKKEISMKLLRKTVVLIVLALLSLPLFSLADWDMTKSYVKGNEVVFNDLVWRAKWWNLNEVPGRFVDSAWEKVEPLYDYSDNVAPSQLPPAGLKPQEVPMFVIIGSDDNFNPDGLHWLLDYVREKRNSDGSKVKLSFYQPISSLWMQANTDAWMQAMDDGHEVANHTYDHGEGKTYTLDKWVQQLYDTTMRLIAPRPFGLGAYESQVKGFRAPFLQYNGETFKAIKELHMLYDSSMEEGWQFDQDGTNNYWPYTLNNGSPAHDLFVKHGLQKPMEPTPGVWELPIYALMTPTDEECPELGITPGLRERCAAKVPYFAAFGSKITGLDWNILYQFGLTEEEYFALLKFNFDKKMDGNRAPFIYGIHSNYYAEPANQRALARFIDYALSHKEVRFVTAQEYIEWMRNPTALEAK